MSVKVFQAKKFRGGRFSATEKGAARGHERTEVQFHPSPPTRRAFVGEIRRLRSAQEKSSVRFPATVPSFVHTILASSQYQLPVCSSSVATIQRGDHAQPSQVLRRPVPLTVVLR